MNTDFLHGIFEHELNEFFIKTCDNKIIRVIRIIRGQKNSWSKDLVVKRSRGQKIRESEIRVQPSQLDPFASTAYKYSPNSFEIYFLKHQDSFNSCSKK